ncbi:protein IMPACT-like isoform X2 [Periplaneta americana]|uniref:protein IMPACT-like isoform X2 n=1 Tax=Periplaneta americana TaxID=6978 RepID=UPI0037E8369F
MVDNLSRQVEEIEALSSIYGNEWKTEDEANRAYSIRIEEGTQSAVLYITVPADYPSASPPQYQLSAPTLSAQDKQTISTQLDEVYLENIGETVIFQWVEKVRELLQQLQLQASSEEEECVVDLPTECSDTKTKSTAGPEIIHGDTITDRKSVFQGHAAFVFSAEEVSLVLEELYKNKKVANATHNIYAYRIYKEDTKCSVQDCNDDGEAQAGGRLLHLLQILGLQNVMVVVTRWYGGVHLGPDRFRHINNAARQVLDLAGLIESANQPKKGKKKNS